MAKSLGWYFAAPHGAMMLSGCFGLVRGVRAAFVPVTKGSPA